MSFTLPNSPLLASLTGDDEIAPYFEAATDIAAMLRFEIALAEAEAEHGVIPADAAKAIAAKAQEFVADLASITRGVERDGMVVPDLIRQLRAHVGTQYGAHVHFGSTSQDVIDTAFLLRMKPVAAILAVRLRAIIGWLDNLSVAFGANPLMARTRMQAAIAVRVADRLRNWRQPVEHLAAQLDALTPQFFVLQFGGPAGTLDALGNKADAVAASLARRLDLGLPDGSWHAQRGRMVELANWLSLVTGALGKIGQDVVLMAQNELAEVSLTDTGGSSAMHHKKNPVKAEVLVTLARFNATQVAGLHHALVHEQERSGTAWTLEWILLPQMVMAAGASTRLAQSLLASIGYMGNSNGLGA
jgi:3-carboxy-cis,cis-muconate cycloisomerase